MNPNYFASKVEKLLQHLTMPVPFWSLYDLTLKFEQNRKRFSEQQPLNIVEEEIRYQFRKFSKVLCRWNEGELPHPMRVLSPN